MAPDAVADVAPDVDLAEVQDAVQDVVPARVPDVAHARQSDALWPTTRPRRLLPTEFAHHWPTSRSKSPKDVVQDAAADVDPVRVQDVVPARVSDVAHAEEADVDLAEVQDVAPDAVQDADLARV